MSLVDHSLQTGASLHEGKRLKEPVRVASTANVTVSGPGSSIDGVSLSNGDRVLLKNQSTGSQNGIYTWTGAATAMTRTADADAAADFHYGFLVYVREGTANAATYWIYSQSAAVTLGTTALTFVAVPTGAALADPTTTRGDLITRGASVIGRLAVGASGTFLKSDGTDPSWGTSAQKFSATGDTGATAGGAFVGATTSGAPTTGTHAVGDFVVDRTGTMWICTTAGTPGTWTTPFGIGGSEVGLGSASSNALSGDVTLTSANTFYDGPSLSLGAGSWLLIGQVLVLDTTAAGSKITAKLWDGTTNLASAESESEAAGVPFPLPVKWVVTPTTTTTYKISVASTVATNGRIKAAAPDNAAGNTASYLLAIPMPPMALPYVHLQDQKAQNTDGGTFTSGAWRTRDLTTEVEDTHSLASLASNQITLAAGTYRVRIDMPGVQVDGFRARLQNITDSTTVPLKSTNGYSSSAATQAWSSCVIAGRFTISTTKTFEVQGWCQTTRSTYGFGLKSNIDVEVYTVAEFWKEG